MTSYKDCLIETVPKFHTEKKITKEQNILNEILIMEDLNANNEYLLEGIGDIVKNVANKIKGLKVQNNNIKKTYKEAEKTPEFRKARSIVDNILSGKSAIYKGEKWYYLVVPIVILASRLAQLPGLSSVSMTFLKDFGIVSGFGYTAIITALATFLVYILIEWAPVVIYKFVEQKETTLKDLKKEIDKAEEGTPIKRFSTGLKLVAVISWIILAAIYTSKGALITYGTASTAYQLPIILFVLAIFIRFTYRTILAWKAGGKEE